MPGRRFQFTLDPVVQLRTAAAEAAREALGAAVRARLAREDDARAAREALDAVVARDSGSRATAHALGEAAAHRASVRAALDEARAAVEAAARAEAASRARCADAVRALDALTQARAVAADAHRAETERADAAILDDLTATRYVRAAWTHA